MRFVLALGAALLLIPTAVAAQTPAQSPDSARVTPPPAPGPHGLPEQPPRIYFGGSIGFSFGTYTRISIQPMVGFRIGPKLSAGGRLSYEYLKDKVGTTSYDSHNFGGSVFTRYRFMKQGYAHVEFQAMNYDFQDGDREWVPFLLLGGGYVKQLDRKTSAYVEVLIDVLQDENSPYGWEPVVNVGIGVGF
jgi:hypothetical protein